LSKEIIAKKAAIVEEVFEKFSNASSVVVVDYRGLTVDEVTELRKELREAGVEMRVIKNTFLRRAADKAGYEGLDETFTGPTAVAFGSEDATAPARIFSKFAEDHEALTIKGGMIDGEVVTLDEIHALASQIVHTVRVNIFFLQNDLRRRFSHFQNCLKHDSRAVLDELTHRMKIGR